MNKKKEEGSGNRSTEEGMNKKKEGSGNRSTEEGMNKKEEKGSRNRSTEEGMNKKKEEGNPYRFTVKCHVTTIVTVLLLLLCVVYVAFVPYFKSKMVEKDICQGSFQKIEVKCWDEKNCTGFVNKQITLFNNSSLYNCSKPMNNTVQCIYCLAENDSHLMWLWLGPPLVCFILFLVVIVCHCPRVEHCCKAVVSSIKTIYEFFLTVFFYPLPTADNDKRTWKVEFITLKFCAWEYAGCDKIWAGIITCLCDKLEEKFGQYRSRYFRKNREDYKMVKSEMFNPSCYKHMRPYTCCCVPKFILALVMIVIVLFLPLVITIIAFSIESQPAKITVSGIVVGVAVVPFIPFAVKLLLNLKKPIKSYIESLQQEMSRPNFKDELGFMHLVKQEVQLLNDLTEFMENYEQKHFRIVLIVDDLDRCEERKVMKMLQAISILLSEPNTRFISLIAVDPRVLVKSLELSVDVIREDARINGHEYLKKIIHLPLWLPEMGGDEVTKFVKAYMPSEDDQVEEATHADGGPSNSKNDDGDTSNSKNADGGPSNSKNADGRPSISKNSDGGPSNSKNADGGPSNSKNSDGGPSNSKNADGGPSNSQNADGGPDSLKKALEVLCERCKLQHICRNPRSVKRICNVLNLAMRLYVSKSFTDEEKIKR